MRLRPGTGADAAGPDESGPRRARGGGTRSAEAADGGVAAGDAAGDTAGDTAGDAAGDTAGDAAGDTAGDVAEPPRPTGRRPLYPRLLRLRNVAPNAWQRAALGEGALAVAAVLVLADLASAWTLLVLPLGVAALVKAHDLLAGVLRSTPADGLGREQQPAPDEPSATAAATDAPQAGRPAGTDDPEDENGAGPREDRRRTRRARG